MIVTSQNPEFKILADFKILAFQNPEFKSLADFKISALRNPEFKILVLQNPNSRFFLASWF